MPQRNMNRGTTVFAIFCLTFGYLQATFIQTKFRRLQEGGSIMGYLSHQGVAMSSLHCSFR